MEFQKQRADEAEKLVRESQVIRQPPPLDPMGLHDPEAPQDDRRMSWQNIVGNPQDKPEAATPDRPQAKSAPNLVKNSKNSDEGGPQEIDLSDDEGQENAQSLNQNEAVNPRGDVREVEEQAP